MQVITIKTIKDVQDFFQSLYDNYDVAFHPDDSFHGYVNEKDEPTFSSVDADNLDAVMKRCFDICDENETDIYETGVEIQTAEFRKRGWCQN